MNVFERLHSGEAIDIRDEDYQREAMARWIAADSFALRSIQHRQRIEKE